MKTILRFVIILVICSLLAACALQATAVPTPLPSATPATTATATPPPTASPTPEPTNIPDDWPFPDDPVVITITLTEEEVKEEAGEYYLEIAQIFFDAEFIIDKWKKNLETGKYYLFVHHKNGGGQFVVTDYAYPNGHILIGYKTGEAKFAMDQDWLQKSEDGREIAFSFHEKADGSTVDSAFIDLAAMIHLRTRLGMGNLPRTLEKMQQAIRSERELIKNDKIHMIYLDTPIERGSNRIPAPFPVMNNFVYHRGVPAYKNAMVLYKPQNNKIIALIGSHHLRDEVWLRGSEILARAIQSEPLQNQLQQIPFQIGFESIKQDIFFCLIQAGMSHAAENSLGSSWFVMNLDDFFQDPLPYYEAVDYGDPNEIQAFIDNKRDTLPEAYLIATRNLLNNSFISVELLK